MGVVKVSLGVSSSNVFTTPVDISVASTLVADSGVLLRGKVSEVAAGAAAMVVHKASDKLTSAYLYVKNIEEDREDFLYVYADTATDDPVVIKIAGGEFAFLPVPNDQTLKVYATRVDQIVEYGVFGLDSSAVTLS